MIDISKCKFEDSWVDETDTEYLYFNYPAEELFDKDLRDLFKTEEYYAQSYGPVLGACLCVEIDNASGNKDVRLAPTCDVDGCLTDVDWSYISVKDGLIEQLIVMAQTEEIKRDIAATFKRLEETVGELKNVLKRLNDVKEETK